MSGVKNIEQSVLLMLAEAAEDNVSQLCPRDMAQRFRPPIPFRKIEIAADHLVEIGHAKAIEYEHATTDYRITQKGLNWVEEHFTRQDDTAGNTSWTEIAEIAKPAEESQSLAAGVHIHNTFAPQNVFHPTNTQTQQGILPTSEGSASLWSAWGTWIGVILAGAAIVVSLYVAGKL